jgi:ABC-type multidrug transport system fused ATPase/permease subunit
MLISGIFQNFQRFELTLRESVAIGRVDLLHEDERLRNVCNQVGLARVVAELPSGLDTVLSSAYGGTSICSGEWQKVALARACVGNASVLVLDEPTASLDPLAEREFYSEVLGLAGERTVVFTSHRVASSRLGSRVAVLEKGRMVAVGSPDELLKRPDSWYAAAFEAQRAAYESVVQVRP